MEFRTIVDILEPGFEIEPCEEMLFVGSCFADSIGQRFREEGFPVTINPYGTMYNPASILHTIANLSTVHSPLSSIKTAFLTLGTNHVYRLKETGEIVDNCAKRPASLFQEEKLSVDECVDYLRQTIGILRQMNPEIHIVLTVSPIRYRKYGYHESQLSKATLLLAIEKAISSWHLAFGKQQTANSQQQTALHYFPAYEIVMDELRDYRFYAADMLHPSEQAVAYVWEKLVAWCFSNETKVFMDEWRPIKEALQHRPFHPESEEYQRFMEKTQERLKAFQEKYPSFSCD